MLTAGFYSVTGISQHSCTTILPAGFSAMREVISRLPLNSVLLHKACKQGESYRKVSTTICTAYNMQGYFFGLQSRVKLLSSHV